MGISLTGWLCHVVPQRTNLHYPPQSWPWETIVIVIEAVLRLSHSLDVTRSQHQATYPNYVASLERGTKM